MLINFLLLARGVAEQKAEAPETGIRGSRDLTLAILPDRGASPG